MARKKNQDDDLLIEDELTAAFLGDDDQDSSVDTDDGGQDDWLEEEGVPGQLAVDVYETAERLFVVAPIAGIEKNDLDVSISDNTLSVSGTRNSGVKESEDNNFYVQECYWGEFSRSITLPVQVQENGIEAVLKDGVLTMSFEKVEQNTVKKIEIR